MINRVSTFNLTFVWIDKGVIAQVESINKIKFNIKEEFEKLIDEL